MHLANRNQQLFSLADFTDRYWRPLMNRVDAAATNSLDELTFTGQCIESILWLRLGIQLNVYSASKGFLLLRNSAIILNDLVKQHTKQLEAMVPTNLLLAIPPLLARGVTNVADRFRDP